MRFIDFVGQDPKALQQTQTQTQTPQKTPNYRAPSITRKYAQKWGPVFAVPPVWLRTVAFIESSHNPDKVNMARFDKGGAWGLMQQMADEIDYKIKQIKKTRAGKTLKVKLTLQKWHGDPQDLLDPDLNMLLAAWQIGRLKARFKKFDTVIAAYHQGEYAVRRRIQQGQPVLSPTSHPKGYDYVQRAIVARNHLLSQQES